MTDYLFYIDILNREYWVNCYIGSDYKKLRKELKKHFEDECISDMSDEELGCIRGKTWGKSGYNPFIFVDTNKVKDTISICAVLAHEAIHAIDAIFEKIDSDDRGELFAHSVASILREYKIQKDLSKKKPKKKK